MNSKSKSFVSGSGDSIATLPDHQIPKRIDLYPKKVMTTTDCLASGKSNSTCEDCPHKEGVVDAFLKQASNMLGRLLWSKKSTPSLDLQASAVETECTSSCDKQTDAVCAKSCRNRESNCEDLEYTVSSCKQNDAYEQAMTYEPTGPLTIGRNRRECERICCEWSNESTDDDPEKLTAKMKCIRNEIEMATAFTNGSCSKNNLMEPQSGLFCDRSQDLDTENFTAQNCDRNVFFKDISNPQCIQCNGNTVKQHLKALANERPDLTEASDKGPSTCLYNATPDRDSGEEDSSSSSNAGFYYQLKTMVENWVQRGLQRYIHPSVLNELQDGHHYYHEVDSSYCHYAHCNVPICHNYNRLCETKSLLYDTESARFTEDPDSATDNNYLQNYLNNYCNETNCNFSDSYSEPKSVPCNRMGIQRDVNAVAPYPSTGLQLHENIKKLSHSNSKNNSKKLLFIGKRNRCGYPSYHCSNKESLEKSQNISARKCYFKDVSIGGGESDYKSVNRIMHELTESMFRILPPTRHTTEDHIFSKFIRTNHTYSKVSVEHLEYNLLYSEKKYSCKNSETTKLAYPVYDIYSTNKDMYQIHKVLTYITNKTTLKEDPYEQCGEYCQSESVPVFSQNIIQQKQSQFENNVVSRTVDKSKISIGRMRVYSGMKDNAKKNNFLVETKHLVETEEMSHTEKEVLRKAEKSHKRNVCPKKIDTIVKSNSIKPLRKKTTTRHKKKKRIRVSRENLRRKKTKNVPQLSIGPIYYTSTSSYNEDSCYEYTYSDISYFSSYNTSLTTDRAYDDVYSKAESYNCLEYKPIMLPSYAKTQTTNSSSIKPSRCKDAKEGGEATEIPGFPGSIKLSSLTIKERAKNSLIDSTSDRNHKEEQLCENELPTLEPHSTDQSPESEKPYYDAIQPSIIKTPENQKAYTQTFTVATKFVAREQKISRKSMDPILSMNLQKVSKGENFDEGSNYIPVWHKGKWRKEKLFSSPTTTAAQTKNYHLKYLNVNEKPEMCFRRQFVNKSVEVEDKLGLANSHSLTNNDQYKSVEKLSQSAAIQLDLRNDQKEATVTETQFQLDDDALHLSVNCSQTIKEECNVCEFSADSFDSSHQTKTSATKCLSKAKPSLCYPTSFGQKSLRGQCQDLQMKPHQSFCGSQSLPSTAEAMSQDTTIETECAQFSKGILKLGPMDYTSTNMSMVSSWWEDDHRDSSKSCLNGANESMPSCLDSEEDEIRARFNQTELTTDVIASQTESKIESHTKAALLYLRGDGLLMTRFISKSTPKQSELRCSRKYGLNYPSLEDIHCLQTVGRLQTGSVATLIRSQNLRLFCDNPRCTHARNSSSDLHLNKHFPAKNWHCRFPEKELKVSLNETKVMMEKGLKANHNCAQYLDKDVLKKLNKPFPSGLKFKPFFPRLYETRVLIPLAKSIVKSVILGAQEVYRRNFADLYGKQADHIGEDLAMLSFQNGIADYLIRDAMESSRMELQTELELDNALTEPIYDAINEAVAAEHASKAITEARRLVIIDNYIKRNSLPASTTSLTSTTSLSDVSVTDFVSKSTCLSNINKTQFSAQKTYFDIGYIERYLTGNFTNISHFKTSNVSDIPLSFIPKASIGKINDLSRDNAHLAFAKRDINNLLNDLIGAIVISEELDLKTFCSKPSAHLAYNLSQAMSLEQLPTASSNQNQQLPKPISNLLSDTEEAEFTESYSYDYDERSTLSSKSSTKLRRCPRKIGDSRTIQIRTSRDNIRLVKELRDCSSVNASSSFNSSSSQYTIPIKGSRLPFSIQKFIDHGRNERTRVKQIPKSAVTFDESHLIRWKRISSCSSESTSALPYLPSTEMRFDKNR